MSVALPELPDAATTASTIDRLRESGVLGDVYGDFSLVISADTEEDFDRYEAIGRFLSASLDGARWWLSDWLLFGEGLFGQRFAQAAEATGLSEGTLVDYMRVAEKVPRSRRRPELHFSHHREVAPLDPEAQDYWLARAVDRGLSRRELHDEIAESKEQERPRLPEPETHPDIELVRVDRSLLAAIVHEASEADDPRYRLVPEELVVRLAASIGEGE